MCFVYIFVHKYCYLSNLNQILLTSKTLFERFGIKSVSMDDIAKALSISKKTLYQFVSGKTELIDLVVEQSISKEQKDILEITKSAEHAIDEMRKIARYVLKFISELNPSLIYDLRKFYTSSWNLIEEGHFSFIKKTIIENIERGKKEDLYRQEIHTEIIAELYVSSSKHFIIESMFRLDYDPSVVYTEMVLYHLHGIMSSEGEQLFNQNKSKTYDQV